MLCGFINLNEGKIKIDNNEISKLNNHWQQNIGYVPQKIYLIDDTIKNNILFGSEENEQDKKQARKNFIRFHSAKILLIIYRMELIIELEKMVLYYLAAKYKE